MTTVETKKTPPLRLLIYSDGRPSSRKALQFGAGLARQMDIDMAVITIRSGTSTFEPYPPFGEDVDLADRDQLPPGLQIMAQSLDVLSAEGLFEQQGPVQLQELSKGYMLACRAKTGKRVPFYVCFGHLVDVLNHEIDLHHYDLLIVAPPQRSSLRKMMLGDTTRKLVNDVHASLLFVRGGQAQSRFVVCADGSPAAKRQFPMLKRMLPVISKPLELIWVQTPGSDAAAAQIADHCIHEAERWLTVCGKQINILRLQGGRPAQIIASAAGEDAVIVVGASLRHDLYRRLAGSMSTQILAYATASVLIVKGLPEGDPDVLEDQKIC